jgi:hypothetical protein
MSDPETRPQARTQGLIVQELGNESLVYDRDTDVAHCLTEVAARVWRGCDGARDLAALASFADVTDDVAAAAVAELGEKGLLAGLPEPSANEYGLSRRGALGRIAKYGAGAASIPLIVSAVAGTPAAFAYTPGGLNASCNVPGTSGPCASGFTCTGNVCKISSGGSCGTLLESGTTANEDCASGSCAATLSLAGLVLVPGTCA